MTDSSLRTLVERMDDWNQGDLQIDGEGRVIRDVTLVGRESKNGYRYSEQALRGAVTLYDRKPVFLDHSESLSRPYDRSTRDLVGTVINPRYAEGCVRADIEVLDTEAGRTFLAITQAKSPAVGMSQVVMADRDPSGKTVTRIRDVVSVDAVIYPATTTGFREQLVFPPLPGTVESLLHLVDSCLPGHLSRLVACPPSHVRRVGLFSGNVLAEVHDPHDLSVRHFTVSWNVDDGCVVLDETATELTGDDAALATWAERQSQEKGFTMDDIAKAATIGTLRERCAELEQELHAFQERQTVQRRVDELLAASGLPQFAINPAFREQLNVARTDAERESLITDRLELIRHAGRHAPASTERAATSRDSSTDAALVAAIKAGRMS